MILLRMIFFLILLLFTTVILGLLKIFILVIVKIMLGRWKQNIPQQQSAPKQEYHPSNHTHKSQEQLVLCTACNSYISQSAAMQIKPANHAANSNWVCKSYHATGNICA